MVESSLSCVICTEPIRYYAVPESCGHTHVCWTCTLTQRLKLADNKCPMCNVLSDRVLITDDPTQNLAQSKHTHTVDKNFHF